MTLTLRSYIAEMPVDHEETYPSLTEARAVAQEMVERFGADLVVISKGGETVDRMESEQ